MSIWLFRAGSAGEFEDKFLTDKRVYLTWNDLNVEKSTYKVLEILVFDEFKKIC